MIDKEKLKSFVKECVLVFNISKKPSKKEYKTTMLVSGLGILLIGFLGFIIHVINVSVV